MGVDERVRQYDLELAFDQRSNARLLLDSPDGATDSAGAIASTDLLPVLSIPESAGHHLALLEARVVRPVSKRVRHPYPAVDVPAHHLNANVRQLRQAAAPQKSPRTAPTSASQVNVPPTLAKTMGTSTGTPCIRTVFATNLSVTGTDDFGSALDAVPAWVQAWHRRQRIEFTWPTFEGPGEAVVSAAANQRFPHGSGSRLERPFLAFCHAPSPVLAVTSCVLRPRKSERAPCSVSVRPKRAAPICTTLARASNRQPSSPIVRPSRHARPSSPPRGRPLRRHVSSLPTGSGHPCRCSLDCWMASSTRPTARRAAELWCGDSESRPTSSSNTSQVCPA